MSGFAGDLWVIISFRENTKWVSASLLSYSRFDYSARLSWSSASSFHYLNIIDLVHGKQSCSWQLETESPDVSR